jgi:predicted nucleotide-binding protein (sugar kinase/HSP70/actin superfamily)
MHTTMTDEQARNGSAGSVTLPLLADQVAAERERLMKEAGLSVGRPSHFKRPPERMFTKDERGTTTILIGGLSVRHDRLIQSALRGLGYLIDLVPVPVKADFQAGKEYGNNGQCNPTYFTVGALVNYLKRLRDREGLSTEQILKDHVFITCGACGPCRFGMYEAEYRLALRNSGFDGFRVLLFSQTGGLDQADVESGLEFNLNFFLSILNSIFQGDVLNEVAYHVRPYETVPGKTNEVFEQCMTACGERLQSRDFNEVNGGALAWLLSKVTPVSGTQEAEVFLEQLKGDYYLQVVEQCAKLIDEQIEVDYTRPKPIVKITGEFWAQTTEGDGNFNMFAFLEREGAEVLVEPVATWISYLLNQARNKVKDTHGLDGDDLVTTSPNLKQKLASQIAYRKKTFTLTLAQKILYREYERYRKALGGTTHALVDQQELVRVGHPYYNSKSGGGEGHLEVAKNIYYCNKDLAHMVLSLKPFGCMPSTQSDGAQAAVVSQYSDMIYLPIETSGEGDINAHSRVQMALGEAKFKCKAEFNEAVARTGYAIEQIRAYVAEHRELRRPLQHVPGHKGVIGRAANFVLHVGSLMNADRASEPRP